MFSNIMTALLLSMQSQLLYPFDTSPARSRTFEAVPYRSHDGLSLQAWRRLQADPEAPLVVYFMGNGGSLSLFEPALKLHLSEGHSVVAMGYRGGGGNPGEASEDDLKADAQALFDALPAMTDGRASRREVHLHGFSPGAGLALHVAAARDVASVTLESAPTQICEVVEVQSGGQVPACQRMRADRWENMFLLERVEEPVLALHGTEDRVVPFSLGKRSGRRVEASGGRFVRLRGAGHNNGLWRGGMGEIAAWVRQ